MQTTTAKGRKQRDRKPSPDKAKLAAVKAEFTAAGVSVAEWARVNGFHRMTVVDVLRGARTGLRGEAHQVAVALGLKKGQAVDVKLFKPAARASA